MMSKRRAPSALRMPISRVRSVTLTSMMFMMTMPPTTSEMQSDRHHHGRDHGEQAVDEAANGVGRQEIEAIGLARLLMEVGAQGDAGQIERLLHGEAAAGLGAAEERDRWPGPKRRLKAVIGNVSGVILTASEGGAEALLDADDGEVEILESERSCRAARRRRETALLRRSSPMTATKERVLLLGIGEEAAVDHADVADVGHVGGNADDGGVLEDQVFALGVEGGCGKGCRAS